MLVVNSSSSMTYIYIYIYMNVYANSTTEMKVSQVFCGFKKKSFLV